MIAANIETPPSPEDSVTAAASDLQYDTAEETQTGDDADSAYGGSTRPSETSSLDSSIFKYREENGRTYHAYGTFALCYVSKQKLTTVLRLHGALGILTP